MQDNFNKNQDDKSHQDNKKNIPFIRHSLTYRLQYVRIIFIFIFCFYLIDGFSVLLSDFYVNSAEFKKAYIIQNTLFKLSNNFVFKNTYYPMNKQFMIGNINFLAGDIEKSFYAYKLVHKNIKLTKFNKNLYCDNLFSLALSYYLYGNYNCSKIHLNKIPVDILLKNNDICTLGLVMNLYFIIGDYENAENFYKYVKNFKAKNEEEKYLKNISILKYKILQNIEPIDENIVLQLDRYISMASSLNSKCDIILTLYNYYNLKKDRNKKNHYLEKLQREIGIAQPSFFDINLIFIVSNLLFNENKISEAISTLNSAYPVYKSIYFDNDNDINKCYIYYQQKYSGKNNEQNILCDNLLNRKKL